LTQGLVWRALGTVSNSGINDFAVQSFSEFRPRVEVLIFLNTAMGYESRKDWQLLLKEALLETDRSTLQRKAQQLEESLFLRAQQLDATPDGELERQAIKDAAHQLLRLKVERLGYPLDKSLLDLDRPAPGNSQQ
jgi:hypothetical protein